VLGRHVGRGGSGSFDAHFAHVWRLREGKVAAFREVSDTALITGAI
jgi:ketosteroid isomerase-like protein